MDRSVEFYKKLGFSVIRESDSPTRKIVFVGNGLVQLEIFEPKNEAAIEVPSLSENEIGIKHIAFHVDDIEGAVEKLKKSGIEFTSEISRRGKRANIFFEDPDGTQLQLLQG
jgi:catechol 2,3-dioxygenase-like lactoylglutathione lyase family enzyme